MDFRSILNHKKLKASSARMMMLELLAKPQSHLSAEEVYAILKPQLPGLSLGTVYKNLEDLREAGLIRLVASPNQIKKYEWEKGDHFHLVSEQAIKDFENQELFEKVKKLITESLKDEFEVEGLDIQVIGKIKN